MTDLQNLAQKLYDSRDALEHTESLLADHKEGLESIMRLVAQTVKRHDPDLANEWQTAENFIKTYKVAKEKLTAEVEANKTAFDAAVVAAAQVALASGADVFGKGNNRSIHPNVLIIKNRYATIKPEHLVKAVTWLSEAHFDDHVQVKFDAELLDYIERRSATIPTVDEQPVIEFGIRPGVRVDSHKHWANSTPTLLDAENS